MKTCYKVIIATVLLLSSILVGCPSVTPPGANTTLSGKVIDTATGAGVPGLNVDFLTYATTTGADGSFKIDLGNKGGTVNGNFCIHGPGYAMTYAAPATLNANTDTHLSLYATSLSTPAITHSVTIKILNSISEIAAGTLVYCGIFNPDFSHV